jgi:hypothetical protein
MVHPNDRSIYQLKSEMVGISVVEKLSKRIVTKSISQVGKVGSAAVNISRAGSANDGII